jgi:enolase
MNIQKIKGLEIIDANGKPTLECHIVMEDGISVRASVPSGLSKSKYEAVEMRDEVEGVSNAIETLENVIAPLVVEQEPNVVAIDQLLLELDGTENKSKLGANTMLAVSVAVLKAQAHNIGCQLYELVAQLFGADTVTLPFPLFNMVSGGAHASNDLAIQEFLILPGHAQNFRESLESALMFHKTLHNFLKKKKIVPNIGREGAFMPQKMSDIQVLDMLSEVIEQLGDSYTFRIALDVAASQFFDPIDRMYKMHKKMVPAEELLAWYQELIAAYPIFSIEDGLNEDDWKGWRLMMETLGDTVQIVGDDLCATDPARIWHAIETKSISAAIIKPNQVGTITETLQSLQLCHEYGLNMIVSHRSGETTDTFIADLAVGTSAGQIKAGGCVRGEHTSKYNRLLQIEDQLMVSLLEP